jgi:hypothetical protein
VQAEKKLNRRENMKFTQIPEYWDTLNYITSETDASEEYAAYLECYPNEKDPFTLKNFMAK